VRSAKRDETKIRPTTRRTLRALGGRRIVIEGFGRRAPALVAIAAGDDVPVGAWISPTELRRLGAAVRKILR
jgi:hypothetical protein